MISRLHGIVALEKPGELTMDVHGVGYCVRVPLDSWEKLQDKAEATLYVSTFVREDRFDLFGFLDKTGKALFEACIELPGVGPKLALELCSVPRSLLHQAIAQNDPKFLANIKGVGKKTAEKLLVEFKSLAERHPYFFQGAEGIPRISFDQDAVDALASLGYDMPTILDALGRVSKELHTTEERVTAALRSL